MAYKRQAGKSTREMANQRRKSVLQIAIIGIGILIVLTLFASNTKVFGGIGILIFLVLMGVLRNFFEGQIDRAAKQAKQALRGAKAEEKIGELLEQLPNDEYYVLHDVQSPYGNIDHIVIKKNCGIFLLETKAHGGRVEIDGDSLLVNGKLPEKDFIFQVLRNTYWLREQIGNIVGSKPWITPIIVFTNAFVPPNHPIKGVYIVNKKYLLPLLRRKSRPNNVLARIWEVKEEIDSELS